MASKKRFWFYSGRHALALAQRKVSGVPGAVAMSREDAKSKKLSIPAAALEGAGDWTWLVVAPAEAADDDDE